MTHKIIISFLITSILYINIAFSSSLSLEKNEHQKLKNGAIFGEILPLPLETNLQRQTLFKMSLYPYNAPPQPSNLNNS